MKNLTDGAISMSDALGSASLASSAGLTTKQIKELTTVAKGASIALGRDMTDALQRVFRGTIKIEPELLDELGLMVKVDDANKAYAKTLGKTVSTLTDYERRQAFVNAVTTQGINKYKELADQAANPFSKLLSTVKDLSTGVLTTMNSVLGPFVNMLAQSPTALLLGMTAIVGLLLKQAIPAVGNMQAAWEATDKAVQESLSKQRKALEDQKSAVLALNEEKVKAAQQKFVETRDTSIQGLESSGIKKAKLKGIDDAARLGNFIGLSEEQIKAQTEVVRKELEKARGIIEREIAKTQKVLDQQGKNSGKTFLNAQAEMGRLNNQLSAIQNFEEKGLQSISGAATAQALVQKNLMTTDTEITSLTQKIGKFEQMGQRLAVIRGAVQATEAGGFRLGFADLFDSISKGTGKFDEFGNVVEGTGRKFSALEKINMGLKGSFQVLTVGISRLLGTFAIWAAVFTVLLPLLSWGAEKLGLLSGALDKLDEATDKATTTSKTFLDIQEKLSKTGILAEQYELQAGAALALADSIGAIVKQQEELTALREKGSFLDKLVDSQKFTLGLGTYDKDAELQTIKVYEKMVKDGLIPKNAVNISRIGIVGKPGEGARFQAPLTVDNFNKATSGREQSRAAYYAREEITKTQQQDPELRKELEEFSKSSIATTNNLKELNTISTEYSISLVNQSKELKALNSLGSSAGTTVKNFAHRVSGSASTLQNFLKGVTSDFEQLAGTKLGTTLANLTAELSKVEADAQSIYEDKLLAAKDLPAKERASALEKAKEEKTLSISSRQNTIINSKEYGGISKINSQIASFSIEAATKLGQFAQATSEATLAQANITKKLRALAVYTTGSDRSALAVNRAEVAAAREKVKIEERAIRSNREALTSQIKVQEEYIKTLPGFNSNLSALEGGKELATTTAKQGISKEELQAHEDLKAKSLSGTMSLISLISQLNILNNSIKTLYASLDDKEVINFQNRLKSAEDTKATSEAANTIGSKIASNKLSEEFAWINDIIGDTTNLSSMKKYREELLAQTKALNDADTVVTNTKAILDTYNDALIAIRTKLLAKHSNDKSYKLEDDPEYKGPKGALDAASDKNTLAIQDKKSVEIDTRAIKSARIVEVEILRQKILDNTTNSLSEQVDLASSYSSLLLSMNKEYSSIANYNAMGVSSLLEQDKLEQSILTTKRAQLVKLVELKDPEAKAKLITLEQDALNSKLTKVSKLTEMLKQQDELTLKIIEKEGRWKDLFSGEGLNAALTLMADRIEETMGKSKSAMSQFVVGIVDAADTITDNFTTMLQKMDETKVSWVAFRDMVRNTFSDMFKNMATDILKNQIKSMMLSAMKMFGHDGRSNQEKAADKLGINLTTNSEKLNELNTTITSLIQSLYMKSPEYVDQQAKVLTEDSSRTSLAVEELRQRRMLEGNYPGYSNSKPTPTLQIEPDKVKTYGIGDQSILYEKLPDTFRTRNTIDSVVGSPVLSNDNQDNTDTPKSVQKFLNEKWGEAQTRQMQGMQSSTPMEDSLSADVWVSNMENLSLSIDKLGLLIEPKTAAQQSTTPTDTISSSASSIITSDTLTSIDKLGDATSPVTVVLEELGVTVDRLTGTFGKLETIIPQTGINSSVGLNALEPFKADYSLANDKSGKLISKGGTEIKDASTNIKDGSYGILDASKILTDQLPNILGRYAGSGSAGGLGGSIVSILAKGALTYLMGPAGAVGGYAPTAAYDQVAAGAIPFQYAKGGIMSQFGDVPLKTYSSGGIANSPQLALYGEGRKNEAYVPLPDNRTIPVTLNGGGGGTTISGDTNIKIEINNNSDTKVSVESAQQLSVSLGTKVKAMVQEELMKQMKPRGILYADY
jgi:hypothetical protein